MLDCTATLLTSFNHPCQLQLSGPVCHKSPDEGLYYHCATPQLACSLSLTPTCGWDFFMFTNSWPKFEDETQTKNAIKK